MTNHHDIHVFNFTHLTRSHHFIQAARCSSMILSIHGALGCQIDPYWWTLFLIPASAPRLVFCVCACVCVCLCMCMYVCLCMCSCMCMCMCMCVFVHVCVFLIISVILISFTTIPLTHIIISCSYVYVILFLSVPM